MFCLISQVHNKVRQDKGRTEVILSIFTRDVYTRNGDQGNEMLVGSLSYEDSKININLLVKCGDTGPAHSQLT